MVAEVDSRHSEEVVVHILGILDRREGSPEVDMLLVAVHMVHNGESERWQDNQHSRQWGEDSLQVLGEVDKDPVAVEHLVEVVHQDILVRECLEEEGEGHFPDVEKYYQPGWLKVEEGSL